MKKRALVVGCGGMGRGWIKNVMDNSRSEVAGIVDVRPEAVQEAAKQFNLDEKLGFTDIRKALRKTKPDFVVDVTIPESHRPVTIAALKKGIPVIGEKPMAESMASARKMVAASDKSGKLYMVSQSRRYDKNHAACRKAVETQTIGTLTTINCDFYIGAHFGGFRDEMPSPLILDMAIHHFDMCRFITGADPVSVYAKEFNPKGSWYKGDVSASCIFEMSNGIIFTYRGSWCGEGMHTSWNGDWRIIGDRGTMIMEKDKPPQAQRVKDLAQAGFHRDMETVDIPVPAVNGEGIAGSLNEILDYFETGAKPQGECHDNIKSLAMVFAVIESSKKGRPVQVKW